MAQNLFISYVALFDDHGKTVFMPANIVSDWCGEPKNSIDIRNLETAIFDVCKVKAYETGANLVSIVITNWKPMGKQSKIVPRDDYKSLREANGLLESIINRMKDKLNMHASEMFGIKGSIQNAIMLIQPIIDSEQK